jgi:hypothetical protein
MSFTTAGSTGSHISEEKELAATAEASFLTGASRTGASAAGALVAGVPHAVMIMEKIMIRLNRNRDLDFIFDSPYGVELSWIVLSKKQIASQLIFSLGSQFLNIFGSETHRHLLILVQFYVNYSYSLSTDRVKPRESK